MVIAAESGDKTIKGILTKLALIMGFILIVPGIMSNVLDIDPLDGCVKVPENDVDKYEGVTESDRCWRNVTGVTANVDDVNNPTGIDKLTKAKISFDEDVIGLISWALTVFMLLMVIVGFVFPGRDIMAYMKSNKEDGD